MMIAASTSSNATQPAPGRRGPEDDGLRTAALKVIRSSGYPSLRRLRCEVADAVAIIQGVLPSYYLKQMAQAILQRLDGIRNVVNLVEVRETVIVRDGDNEASLVPSERTPTRPLA
jgi:hypothetical protein